MTWQILVGDCRSQLATLAERSVQCVVTSPPYWGLRDYGVEGQLGLEPTVEEFIENMVEVFAAVRRVLRDDGTLWLNIGDCFYGPKNFGGSTEGTDGVFGRRKERLGAISGKAMQRQEASSRAVGQVKHPTLKTKDLVLQPFRLALALQADGWYVRSDNIWHKPNPMPESVTDRCTRSHEYLFHLTKSERYYYDNDAIREPLNEASLAKAGARFGGDKARGYGPARYSGNEYEPSTKGANKRTVWTIPTASFKEAHFATFPPRLVEPCILAGTQHGDTVLDPFNGAGTTGLVATRLGRDYIGIELNPEYAAMTRKRITDDNPLFNSEDPAA